MSGRDTLTGHRGRFTRRALLLGAAQTGLLGALAWRLHRLQSDEGTRYARLADANRTSTQLLAPARGVIFDRSGEIVASNVESLRVLVVPDLAQDLPGTLDRVARLVPVTEAARDRVLRIARRQSPTLPIVVADGITWHQFAQLNVLAPSLPGIRTDIAWTRRYRHGSDLAHIVGYVGAADASEVHIDPVMRLPGFRVGKAGVERGFDEHLRGRAGNVQIEVNALGRGVRKLGEAAGERGRPLVLSVDHACQRFALGRLAEHRRAAVVGLAVETGDIIVLASTPTYDPNDLVLGLTPEDWKELTTAQDDPFINRSITGQYPPGSTFKMVTALAGLEAGVIRPDTVTHCGGVYALNRARFRCWKRRGHGGVALHRAIRESCDVYFYDTARKVGIERLAAAARRLGLGQTYPCGLPLQKPGVVPDPAWKRTVIGKPWYGGETVIAGIGQGFVLATPLQLAVMTARIASGRAIMPRIALPETEAAEEPASPLEFDREHVALVRAAMTAVVNEPGGTAGRSKLPIADVLMAGKTGTSQVVGARASRQRLQSLGWEAEDHALFVGYAPADAPRYAVACVVEHGGSGARAAAPIVRDVMVDLLQRDPLARPSYRPESAPRRTAEGGRGGEAGDVS